MSQTRLSLLVSNPSEFHNIGIELWLDSTKFFDNKISPGSHHVVHEFDGIKGEHIFRIILKDKIPENTKINSDGNILEDSLIEISDVTLDEVNIDQLMWALAEYVHDGNGSYDGPQSHKYFGKLGCNGQVRLSFSCPVYIWFLENI